MGNQVLLTALWNMTTHDCSNFSVGIANQASNSMLVKDSRIVNKDRGN